VSLFKGIVTEKIETTEISLKPMHLLARDYNSLEGVTLGITGQLIIDKKVPMPPGIFNDEVHLTSFMVSLKFDLSHFLGFRECHNEVLKARLDSLGMSKRDIVDLKTIGKEKETSGIARNIARLVLDGTLDRHYGLEYGTLLKVFEYEYRVRSALPTDVFFACILSETITAKKTYNMLNQGTNTPIVGYKPEARELERLLKGKEVAAMFSELNNRIVPPEETCALLDIIGAHSLVEQKARFYDFQPRK
ncbi:MAG TPA: hypothetical protein PLO51_05055, partial [Candidatus Micrarchaeota archaeon]|nr:hypothetical protein [Candidatus Micrarchaeota archaeon]